MEVEVSCNFLLLLLFSFIFLMVQCINCRRVARKDDVLEPNFNHFGTFFCPVVPVVVGFSLLEEARVS